MLVKFNKVKAMETLPEMIPGKEYEVAVSGKLKDGKSFKGSPTIAITEWKAKQGWKWDHPGWLNADKDVDHCMIERNFDISFIADLALREKQIQQNYRPIIAAHKWFARIPGTLFRGLLLSEFESRPLRDVYYQQNEFHGIRIADPFMGGGIPLIEANRVGCDIIGYDINPMAYWIVKREIEHIDIDSYREAAEHLRHALEVEIGPLYRTRCLECGSPEAYVKYFLWVKTKTCSSCVQKSTFFPEPLLHRTSGIRRMSLCAWNAVTSPKQMIAKIRENAQHAENRYYLPDQRSEISAAALDAVI